MAKRRRRRGRRIVIALLLLVVVVVAVWWVEPIGLFGLLQWATPDIVWRVPISEPLVALSFDDGPHPAHTPQVLSILAAHDAHATFFLIGQRARAHPELVQAIKAGGHETGNHYFHRGTCLADRLATFSAKLTEAEQAIGLSAEVKLFRPPAGLAWPWQLRRARELGYICVLGSAYPHDPAHPPVGYIRWLVTKNLVPGAVIILHDGISDPSRTIQALPGILAAGQARGFRFVTIGTLLEEARGRRTRSSGRGPRLVSCAARSSQLIRVLA
jgi:peptidoglycan/xylan/chitin deacetylase (PgdA/CDA1 family)